MTWVGAFLLETELLASGAFDNKAASHSAWVVPEGNIITGQNTASSEAAAK